MKYFPHRWFPGRAGITAPGGCTHSSYHHPYAISLGKSPPPEGGKQDVTCDISDDGDDHCYHVLRPRFEPDMLECILHVLSHVKSSEGVVTGREVRQEQDPPRFSDAPGQLLPPYVLFFLSCQTNTPWPRVKRGYFNHNGQRVCSSVWIKAPKRKTD